MRTRENAQPRIVLEQLCEDNKAERVARDRLFRATHPDYYKNYRATQPYRDACKELRAIEVERDE